MKTVFIYGTLRRGGRLHSWMRHSEFIGEAVLTGAKLYDLGNDVPGIYPGEGCVKGELFTVTDPHFEDLLYLENGYVDTPVTVEMNGGVKYDAIAFIWPDITQGYGTSCTPTEVESGDWMKR